MLAHLVVATARAWMRLVLFDLLRPQGFQRVHDYVRLRPAGARAVSSLTIDEIVWAVDEACVWYVKRAACLQRSFVATLLLRRYGHAAVLTIGCRPLPFESHAWVEVDGRIVNDLTQYQKAFTVLDRL